MSGALAIECGACFRPLGRLTVDRDKVAALLADLAARGLTPADALPEQWADTGITARPARGQTLTVANHRAHGWRIEARCRCGATPRARLDRIAVERFAADTPTPVPLYL